MDKQKFKSQKEEVLYLLKKKKWTSSMEFAMIHGILRYGAAIYKLRREGWGIVMKERFIKVGKRTQRQTIYGLLY